jgi:hypothetical protein
MMKRKHINEHPHVPKFVSEAKTGPIGPRLAYGVKNDGSIVWAGKAHRNIPAEHRREIKGYGFFMKIEDSAGHFPYSTSIPKESLGAEDMEAAEAKLREHGFKGKIHRQAPI